MKKEAMAAMCGESVEGVRSPDFQRLTSDVSTWIARASRLLLILKTRVKRLSFSANVMDCLRLTCHG